MESSDNLESKRVSELEARQILARRSLWTWRHSLIQQILVQVKSEQLELRLLHEALGEKSKLSEYECELINIQEIRLKQVCESLFTFVDTTCLPTSTPCSVTDGFNQTGTEE